MWILKTPGGVTTQSLEWVEWAKRNGVVFQSFDNASDAHRAFWGREMPNWTPAQVEDATRNTAWPFYTPKAD